jgi:hypothetical protein
MTMGFGKANRYEKLRVVAPKFRSVKKANVFFETGKNGEQKNST